MEAELAAAVEERLEQQRRASDLEAQLEASKSIAQQEQRGLAARASNLAAQLEKVKGEAAKVCAITCSPEAGTNQHEPYLHLSHALCQAYVSHIQPTVAVVCASSTCRLLLGMTSGWRQRWSSRSS